MTYGNYGMIIQRGKKKKEDKNQPTEEVIYASGQFY